MNRVVVEPGGVTGYNDVVRLVGHIVVMLERKGKILIARNQLGCHSLSIPVAHGDPLVV